MTSDPQLSFDQVSSSSHEQSSALAAKVAVPPTATTMRLKRGWLEYVFWTCGGIALIALAWVITSAVGEAHRSARRSASKANLKQIATAIHQYLDTHDCYPPAYTVNAKGRPLQSWRVLLLPALGQDELYRQIRLDEPWDSPHNKQFHNRRPAVYSNPLANDSVPGEAHYLAIVGRDTMWPDQYSVRISDISHGTSNTAMLVEYSGRDVNWMEPDDLTRKDIRTKIFTGIPNPAFNHDIVHVAFADGAVRAIRSDINRRLANGLFARTPSNDPLPGVDWPPADVPEQVELPPAKPASAFPRSQFSPVLDVPLDQKQNVVHCATFQIAWDQIRKRLAAAPDLGQGPNSVVVRLNGERFPPSELSPEAYVAFGGDSSAGNLGSVREELQKKFPAHPIPSQLHRSDLGIEFYCYLYKQLPFAIDFDRFPTPLEFHASTGTSKVESFGVESFDETGGRMKRILEQVTVLDHVTDEDFVLKLGTSSGQDEIYLAKVQPAVSLQDTLNGVLKRIKSPAKNGFRREMGMGDRLGVPVLQLSVERRYGELEGLEFRNPELRGRAIVDALQTIKFRLDETGAIVESEALIVADDEAGTVEGLPYNPNQPRKLVLDRPFLLFIRETQAQVPYLVAWIANDELMEVSR